MDGRVLGTVSVKGEGGKQALGTRKPAALFALLVTSPGCRCSREEIADALYPGETGVDGRVDRVVTDLRKVLGGEVLPHAGKSGFVTLNAPAGSTDYLRFRESWQRASELPPPEQFALIRAALEEWSEDGEPLRGLLGKGFELRRERMLEDRVAAVCALLEAAWKARYSGLLEEESEKWYARLPQRMRIFQYYLIAHGRRMSGEELERLVGQWVVDTGTTPDPQLQTVIDRLRGAAPQSTATVLPPIPRQLIADVPDPIGQDDLLRSLVEYISEERRAGRMPLIFLTGMAGVGKSTLAYHLAKLVVDQFPGGAFVRELNGFSDNDLGPADPEPILDGLLAELAPYSDAVGLEAKSGAFRTASAHRSLLLVLDDAFSTKQVLPLLPGSGNCAVIITSRRELGGLCSGRKVRRREVELLTDHAALEVLQKEVSQKDRETYAIAFGELVELCGNLPLALTVVERRLRYEPRNSIPDLVRDMKMERRRLEELDRPDHELSMLVALTCSARVLSKEARLLLWQLGIHPGPSITWHAVKDLGVAGGGMRAERVLGELVAANLVMFRSDRYQLHDLVRAFARHHVSPTTAEVGSTVEAEATEELTAGQAAIRKATVRQVLEHQLQNAWAWDRMLDDQRLLHIGEPVGVHVIEPADLDQALEYLDNEYPTLRQGVELAFNERLDRYMWMLPMALVPYQWRRRHLTDASTDLNRAADIAETVASPVECAMVRRMQAGTQWRLGNYHLAAAQLKRAVRLSEQDESPSGRLSLARSLYALGITLRKGESRESAEDKLRQALELSRELLDLVGEAAALNAIGALLNDRGDHAEAHRLCEEALRVVERTTDHRCRADVLFTLAKVQIARDERAHGVELLHRACDLFRAQEYWPDEDKTRRHLADVLISSGDTSAAVLELERVQMLREQMKGTDVQEIRELLEGLR